MIYTQGCPHHCPGCHNPSTWDFDSGYDVTIEQIQQDILSTPLVTGVTFSGGEPLDQFWETYSLADWAKRQGLNTTLYTGYTVEIINGKPIVYRVNGMDGIGKTVFDYIIDGRFEINNKNLDLPFRGSSNQRLLKRGKDY